MKNIVVNNILKICLSVCIIFLASCKEECDTIVKYKEPNYVNIKLGESVSTFNNFNLSLKSINIKKTPPADTTITKDSTMEAISCVLRIMRPDSTEQSEFIIFPGNFTAFGNVDITAGKPFEHVKIQCDKLHVQPESVDLTIWNATFMQDCKPW